MRVEIESEHLNGVVVIKHKVFEDGRGFFKEIYRKDLFDELGLPAEFVQDNHSMSAMNVLRGLHFQWDPLMGKLVRVTRGAAFLVAVDIRTGSPFFGNWFGLELSEASDRQMWAPAGFARGFLALTDGTEVQYKCTGVYNPNGEGTISWSDPQIGIEWPIDGEPIISERDRSAPLLAQWAQSEQSAHLAFASGVAECTDEPSAARTKTSEAV